MVAFGLETLRLRSVAILTFVAVAAGLAVCGGDPATFSWRGLGIQMIAGLGGSTQVVLSNKMMVRSGGSRIDPMTMVSCTAPASPAVLLPINAVLWDPSISVRLRAFGPLLVCNVLLAFILQVTTALTI